MSRELSAKLKKDFFPFIDKPLRYTGTEDNVIHKSGSNCLKILLVFPDIYEIGMAYQGYQILYHILNKSENIICERAYLPHPDDAKIMRAKNIPLFSLESKTLAKDFDVIGFTLSYELNYTNILECLSLTDIEFYADKRGKNRPLIIAGGTNCYNPEPVAELFDLIQIGDSEELLPKILEEILNQLLTKSSKENLLETLAAFPSVYIPSFYQPKYNEGQFAKLEKIRPNAPEIITKHNSNLQKQNYPEKPLVPLMEITQDRISCEVMRGCTRGCRFCQAGYTYRPVRERSLADIMEQIDKGIKNTGLKGATLLSLSTSDYSNIEPLIFELYKKYHKKQIEISYPSMRAESFSETIADLAGMKRKSSFTFAPEVATDKMRKIVNKNLSIDLIKDIMDIILPKGWRTIKLYFMIGLPYETDEDVLAIANMINDLKRYSRQYGHIHIHAAISPFNPKPFTPFQWVSQDSLETMSRKISILTQNTWRKGVKLDWRSPKVSQIEAVISRGDRRLLPAIIRAHELGAKMDGWHEYFNYERWQQAFLETNLNQNEYLSEKSFTAPLPWDHIDIGISKEFYQNELLKSKKQALTDYCREKCNLCGLEKTYNCNRLLKKETIDKNETLSELQKLISKQTIEQNKIIEPKPYGPKRYRIKFSRGEDAAYLSQLDIIRYLERNIIKYEIPLEYSHGYHPIPHIGFSHPLPFGMTSDCEYMDVVFADDYNGTPENDIRKLLGKQFKLLGITSLKTTSQALMKFNNFFTYEISFDKEIKTKIERLLQKVKNGTTIKRINKKKKEILLNTNEYIHNISFNEEKLVVDFVALDQRIIKPSELLTQVGELSMTEYYGLKIKRSKTGNFKNEKFTLPEETED